ncbi:MAG: hypothetical protein N4J56_007774 [Chroococcidiopsis sp. SAG 2025]|uniref:DUF29 domain-containing protein n=1 Tax=Chroococcidiopsis sp. SAG 2025 TaxID=171389 RepID=UPI0029370382|nr:DUF29 domain-containing protein [Chroococcidiopsis sp. SAG 2025]MDV2998069.1 hypothetical protein [Chroococcidiopsis sp. SAG 2025]
MAVSSENSTLSSWYEQDFVAWASGQAMLLKQGRFEELDLENLIEEVESLSRSDRRAVKSQLIRVLKHLLKLNYQSNAFYYLNSWRSSVVEGRSQIKLIVEDSPSLKPYLAEILVDCYQEAVQQASAETGMPATSFPSACVYSLEQVLDPHFFPQSTDETGA